MVRGARGVAIFERNPPPLVQLLVLNFQQEQRAIVSVLHLQIILVFESISQFSPEVPKKTNNGY
ncbi:hypothetical protein T10_10456 [Trichinella papuae]|uniref:Uncharacterized protein n=1 Tax=Trichinella papuae TaxID=268474 RepID=A0A0V1MPY3_9BILA|nr:hypothetical protein T10_10456 [Trichinella papuae]